MSNAPNTKKSSAKAAKAEATGRHVDFVFGDNVYTLDATRVTWEVMEADNRGEVLPVVRGLLGPEQWETFKTANPEPIVVNDDGTVDTPLVDMALALMRAVGNLGASSSS